MKRAAFQRDESHVDGKASRDAGELDSNSGGLVRLHLQRKGGRKPQRPSEHLALRSGGMRSAHAGHGCATSQSCAVTETATMP